VFEARIGRGKLIACAFDLTADLEKRPVARQMLASLRSYAASTDFEPKVALTPADLASLLRQSPRILSLAGSARASSEEAGFEARRAIDGDPQTLWHSEFGNRKPELPHELVLEFPAVVESSGIVLTPRADGSSNGNPKRIAVLGADGKLLVDATLDPANTSHVIRFREPASGKRLTLQFIDTQTPPFASLAEVDLLPN
jgi:hypothetical protein